MRTATLTAVFWSPSGLGLSYPTGYQSEIEQFLTDVATDSARETNFYSVLTQYYEGVGANTTPVTYAVTSGAALQDADPLPTGAEEQCTTPIEGTSRPCVTDQGIRTELNALIKEKGLATGIGHEYIVFFPPGIDSCFDAGGAEDENCSGTGYCGYHGALASGAPQEVEYANEPDNGDPEYNGNCTAIAGKSAAYQTINTASHEVSESVTDPEVEEPALSWYDENTFKTTFEETEYEFEYGEVGDICAWEFKQGDSALGIFSEEGFETAPSNQTISNKAYLLQTEWDNAHSTCSVSKQAATTKAAFTATPTAPVLTGEAISVDASTSHAPVPITTYEWNWGDGTPPTVTESPTASHIYDSTSGLPVKSFTVELKVTDENSNTATTTQTVEVEGRKPVAEFTAPSSPTSETTHSSIFETPIASLTSGPFSGNVKTVVEEPSNSLKVLSIKRNRHNGSASLRIAVGAPGVITLRTAARRKGAKPTVRPMVRTVARSGSATLQVKPALATLTRLRRRHRVSLKVLITFTPTGGSPRSVVRPVVLMLR